MKWVPEKSSMLRDMLINSFVSLWVGCVKQEADSAFLGDQVPSGQAGRATQTPGPLPLWFHWAEGQR